MKQVGGECPLQGIMPTGKGTPGQEARVFLAFHVLLPLDKGKKCIYALRESSKAWQVIWVFPDEAPVLKMPEEDKPFALETNASKFATGGVLRQQDDNGDWHPCGYISQSFNPAE